MCTAGVGSHDPPKVLHQPDCCLPITGGAIPRELDSARVARELGEQTRRIPRTMYSVLGRAAREQVFERRQLFFAVFTNTDENVCSTRSLLHFGQTGRLDRWSVIRSVRENDSPQDAQRYSYVGTAVLRIEGVRNAQPADPQPQVGRLPGSRRERSRDRSAA